MAYRVLRLIEIEYESAEDFEADRAGWALPENGVKMFGRRGTVYRTATLPAALDAPSPVSLYAELTLAREANEKETK